MFRRMLWLCGALLLAGCGRDAGKPAPAPSASHPAFAMPVLAAPSGAASAPPAGAPAEVVFSLASTAGEGPQTDVHLMAPALEIREKIATVAPDIGCVLTATSDGWAIFCADVFPTPVATLRRVEGGFVLERLGAPTRAVSLPAGGTLQLGTTEAGARAVPGRACDPAVKTKPLKAVVSTRSNPGDRWHAAKIAVVEGGRTLAWPLSRLEPSAVCRVVDPEDGTRQLVCAKHPVCTFRGASGRLEITCGEARTVAFTRCGTVPTAAVETIQRSVAYE